MRTVSALIIGTLWVAAEVSTCHGQQSPKHAEEIVVKGKYSSVKYGYSVVVPGGIKAYRMKAPAPQHGITLDLSQSGAWVNAEYDATLARSVDALATSTAEAWSSSDQLRIVKNGQTMVAGLPARDLVLESERFREGQPNYVHFVLALRAVPNSVGVVYTIGLKARVKDAGDEKVFSALVNSFRLADLLN
jgi:hypothetical protein